MSEQALSKRPLREKAVEEFKAFAALSAYLYVCLGALVLYKSAVLRDVGVSFTIWGIALVKAMILAKFMLLGRMLHLGKRYRDKPLILPTIHHSLMYLILLLLLTTIEELFVGLIHHRAVAELACPRGRPLLPSGCCGQFHHVSDFGSIFRVHLPWRCAWGTGAVPAVFCGSIHENCL